MRRDGRRGLNQKEREECCKGGSSFILDLGMKYFGGSREKISEPHQFPFLNLLQLNIKKNSFSPLFSLSFSFLENDPNQIHLGMGLKGKQDREDNESNPIRDCSCG